MQAQNKTFQPDELAAARPIEFLTENGFSIFRRWEIEQTPPPTNGIFCFLVCTPQELKSEITVEVVADCLVRMPAQMRARIPLSSAFWIASAERHLAEYLWEHNDFPVDNKLTIDCLDPEETILAGRWNYKPAE